MIIYGIPNCDSVRKARRWFEEHDIEYYFYDIREKGLQQHTLLEWIKEVGWETLLNKRSTTWRNVDKSIKDNIDAQSAMDLMCEQPTLIKRPVIEGADSLIVGFDISKYEQILQNIIKEN